MTSERSLVMSDSDFERIGTPLLFYCWICKAKPSVKAGEDLNHHPACGQRPEVLTERMARALNKYPPSEVVDD